MVAVKCRYTASKWKPWY